MKENLRFKVGDVVVCEEPSALRTVSAIMWPGENRELMGIVGTVSSIADSTEFDYEIHFQENILKVRDNDLIPSQWKH